MEPIQTNHEHEIQLTAAGCNDLYAVKPPDKLRFTSTWRLTDEEVHDLIATRKLTLSILGTSHPPVDIMVVKHHGEVPDG